MKQVRELLEKYLLEGGIENLENASALYEALGGIEGDATWCELVDSIDLRIK